jgi:F0F1-type ATP synthase assembly protein I
MQDKNKNNPKKPNRFIVLTLVASQMGVTIYVGAKLGKYFDAVYLNPKPWFTILGTLSALILSLYSLLRQLKKLNKYDD